MSSENQELGEFFIIMQKGIKKHGHKTVIRQIQAIDIQKNNVFYYVIFNYLINEICREFNVRPLDLYEKKKRGKVTIARKIAVLLAKNHLDITDEQLAVQFDRTRQVVYNIKLEYLGMKKKRKADEYFINQLDKINKKVSEYIKDLKGGGNG